MGRAEVGRIARTVVLLLEGGIAVAVAVAVALALAVVGESGIVVVVQEPVLEMDEVGAGAAGNICFVEVEGLLWVRLFCLGLARMALGEEGEVVAVLERLLVRWDECSRSRGRTLFVNSC